MFNLTLAEVITVLGMCAATYSSRLLGYLFLRRKKLSPQTRKLLDAAPGCVMVSVVAPAFMTTNPADLVTLIVVVFLAKKLNLAVMTALAVALNALLRHLWFILDF